MSPSPSMNHFYLYYIASDESFFFNPYGWIVWHGNYCVTHCIGDKLSAQKVYCCPFKRIPLPICIIEVNSENCYIAPDVYFCFVNCYF